VAKEPINWAAALSALAAEGLGLDPAAEQFLRAQPPGLPVLVGCSGGADSVYLTLALCVSCPQLCEQLVVVVVDHGQRQASMEDVAFVEEMGRQLGLRVMVRRLEIAAGVSEAVMREARNAAFGAVGKALGASVLCLGHHLDDVAEGMLMRLGRGTGLQGLCAPRPVQKMKDGLTRCRPLLRLRSAVIRERLLQAGVSWCEDASNQSLAFTRNRIRQAVVPAWESTVPQNWDEGLVRSHHLLSEAEAALSGWVDSVCQRGIETDSEWGNCLRLDALAKLPEAVVRGSLWQLWERSELPPGAHLPGPVVDELVVRIVRMTWGAEQAGEGSWRNAEGQVTQTVVWRVRSGTFSFVPIQVLSGWAGSVGWDPRAGPVWLPDGSVLRGEWVRGEELLKQARQADPWSEGWLATDCSSLRVSGWEAGDRFQRLGAPGSRKLQDQFTDRKIPIEHRRRLPVIKDVEGSILFVPGLGIAERCKLTAIGKTALRLTYQRP